MQVEPARHQFHGVALEVAPVIMVGKARRGNARPGGQRPQCRYVLFAERLINCQELVVLVFAQETLTPPPFRSHPRQPDFLQNL